MMTETELWYSLNGGLTANAIYMAGTFFLLWVAFRAANQMRAEDANVFNKTLVSLFSLVTLKMDCKRRYGDRGWCHFYLKSWREHWRVGRHCYSRHRDGGRYC